MKTKNKQLLSLTAIFAVALTGSAVCAGFSANASKVSAATYSVFSSASDKDSLASVEDGSTYLQCSFTGENEASFVEYRSNLAYKWYWDTTTSQEGSENNYYTQGFNYFSFEFAFTGDMNFETFTFTLNSSENSITDDELTTNEVIFLNEDGNYSVAFRNNSDKDLAIDELEKHEFVLTADRTVKISLTEVEGTFDEQEVARANGEYTVVVECGNEQLTSTFDNIAGTYAKYTAPNATLKLSASVANADNAEKTQTVDIRSMNGQSFAIADKDNVAPVVLCVADDVKHFTLGATALDFNYQAISVLNKSVTCNVEYYQYVPDTEVTWSTLSSTAVFLEGENFEAQGNVEYIAVRFTCYANSSVKYYYYLSDYASDTVAMDNGYTYIKANLDNNKPVYNDLTTAADKTQTYDYDCPAYLDYQQAVADIVADGELRAGSGYYFYLPSMYALISDQETAYSGLKFTIYYRSSSSTSASTSSSLAYNALKIPTTSLGDYQFKVVAVDKSGNEMEFRDDNGRIITVSSTNIWDLEQIPMFTFTVQNYGLTVDEITDLDKGYGYVDQNMTIPSLTINGTVDTKTYELYYLNGIAQGNISYKDMIEFVNKLNSGDYSVKVTAANFTEELVKWYNTTKSGSVTDETSLEQGKIPHFKSDGPTSDDDDGWETHGNYNEWKEDSLSFTPRSSGYYILVCRVTDSDRIGEITYTFQVVSVSAQHDQSYGDTYWIENNMLTFVFIIIAGVAFVAIIALLLIKPSDGKKKEKATAKKENNKNKKE